jgi:predicted enzyme related to lactoylglutathione lyase
MSMGDGMNYTMFKVGAAAEKAKALGPTIDVPPTDNPIGKIAFFHDPTGASFAVITAGQ